MLRKEDYIFKPATDPLKYYYWPFFGGLYRRRVEMCLAECSGGQRVLEVGYGSGLAFMNLAEKYKEIHGIDLLADQQKVSAMWDEQGIKTHLVQGDVTDMQYPDSYFDTVLLVSILEHLKPEQLNLAYSEIRRVLKVGGQMVFGSPVERPLMVTAFSFLGHNIREHHYSTEKQIIAAAQEKLTEKSVKTLEPLPFVGGVYKVGHFVKTAP